MGQRGDHVLRQPIGQIQVVRTRVAGSEWQDGEANGGDRTRCRVASLAELPGAYRGEDADDRDRAYNVEPASSPCRISRNRRACAREARRRRVGWVRASLGRRILRAAFGRRRASAAQCIDQAADVGIWLHLQLYTDALEMRLRRAECFHTQPGGVQHAHEGKDRGGVVRVVRQETPPQLDRGERIVPPLRVPRHPLQQRLVEAREARPLVVVPSLERRSVRHGEAAEQLAPVQLERLVRAPAALQRRLEGARVAPEPPRFHADQLGTARDDGVAAERPAQDVERLAERAARVCGIELGPEEGDQRVAAVEAAWAGEGEVGQECHAFRLAQQVARLRAGGAAQVDRAQRAELDHGTTSDVETDVTRVRVA